jgi:hypothetical protein
MRGSTGIQPVATIHAILQTSAQGTTIAGMSVNVLAAMVHVPAFVIGEM